MERLTVRDESGMACVSRKIEESENGGFMIVDRLAAYEDTGLEPEDVRRLQKDWTSLIMKLDEMGGMPHISELIQAEQDERLVVLPCGSGAELERDGYTFRADHWNHVLTAFRDAPETKSGKQVALFNTKEAEAALKGGANEDSCGLRRIPGCDH